VAIVTGGTRGIGKAIADQLSQLDCHVIYTGTKPQRFSSKARQEYWSLDLSDDQSTDVFCRKLHQLPGVDILVNNAGINIIEPVDEISVDHWDKIIKINLTAPMRLMKEAAKIMKRDRKGGRILNISSIFGLVSKEKRCAYSASKAGLIGLTRAAALDLAANNILVNALCPGFILTDLTKGILTQKEIKQLSKEIPLGRLAQATEVSQAAIFLCSELNTYITGQAVVVDGGATIR